MSILITGANGFVGKHAVRFFLDNTAYQINCLDLVHKDEIQDRRVHCFDVDMMALEDLRSVIRKAHPRKILHLAGMSSVRDSIEDPLTALEMNIFSCANLLEAVRLENLNTKLLVVSSSEVYGSPRDGEVVRNEESLRRPETPYSASKAAIEIIALQYFHTYGIKTLIARPFNHTGPGQRESFVLPAFAKKLMDIKVYGREPVIYMGNIEVERDFLDVRDVVRAYHLLLEKGKPGEAYNICSGKIQPLRWILEEMLRISGLQVEIRADPGLERRVDIPMLAGDNSKITRETEWEPEIELDETLRDILVYWEKRAKARRR
jgi:GDP-4-dehydro-6-deoxy-D-mannose reductase